MKAFLSIAMFFTASVLALPEAPGLQLRQESEVNTEDVQIVDLEVQDDRFGDQVFHGTPKAIYEEMKALKPELFEEEDDLVLEERSLDKRQGSISCDWGDVVTGWNNCVEGIGYLQRLGSAWCSVGRQPACARVSCSRGCGMFLCNRLDAVWRVSCRDIAGDVRDIYEKCQGSLGFASGRREFGSHYIGVKKQSC